MGQIVEFWWFACGLNTAKTLAFVYEKLNLKPKPKVLAKLYFDRDSIQIAPRHICVTL